MKTTLLQKVITSALLVIMLIVLGTLFLARPRQSFSGADIPPGNHVYNSEPEGELMASGWVDDESIFVTPLVNYRFKIEAPNNEGFYVQYSAKGGGWTEKTLIVGGCYHCLISKPENAVQGPLRISAGPGETGSFPILLYRIPRR